MTYRKAKQYLESNSYVIVRHSKHVMFRHKKTGVTVPVPNHPGDISPGVIKSLKDKTGLSFR